MSKTVKESGQVFTPSYIVCHMLDLCGYKYGKKILRKHVIDNSCGNGAILCEVVDRYCQSYLNWNENSLWLKGELETYIHGIDNDPVAVEQCIINLNAICSKYGIENVSWDVFLGDTLVEERFDKQMDYVIGNPPYVRTHNLNDSYEAVKQYNFTQTGMVDLYVTFFEIGINMLNKHGKLCYITPSSWTTSKAGNMMRDYFKSHKLLRAIIDMEHYDVFENFSVYTMITYLDKKHQSDDFTYNRFNEEDMTVDKVDVLNINDIDINGEFYFSPHEDLKLLTDVKTHSYDKVFYVKNGIATLLDKVFINDNLPFDDYTTQMLKASTGTWSKCFFPYDKFGNPLPSTEIQQNNAIMSYLLENQEALLKRKCDTGIEDWFYYGRSQGLRDTFRQRLAINSIIKDIDSMKFNIVPEGCSVYSGLYIYSETEDISIARQHLETEEFIRYVKSLKKYKSGGFYTFSSKDVETYLNYKIATNM